MTTRSRLEALERRNPRMLLRAIHEGETREQAIARHGITPAQTGRVIFYISEFPEEDDHGKQPKAAP